MSPHQVDQTKGWEDPHAVWLALGKGDDLYYRIYNLQMLGDLPPN